MCENVPETVGVCRQTVEGELEGRLTSPRLVSFCVVPATGMLSAAKGFFYTPRIVWRTMSAFTPWKRLKKKRAKHRVKFLSFYNRYMLFKQSRASKKIGK